MSDTPDRGDSALTRLEEAIQAYVDGCVRSAAGLVTGKWSAAEERATRATDDALGEALASVRAEMAATQEKLAYTEHVRLGSCRDENQRLVAEVNDLREQLAAQGTHWREVERLEREALRDKLREARRVAFEEAATIAENVYGGKAHTYASENADVYIAQDATAKLIAQRLTMRALSPGAAQTTTEKP